MSMIPRRLLTISILTFVVCWGPILAQSSTGTISGTVSDEHRAVIAEANVTVRHTATGFVRSATTDHNGRYRLVDIPTGIYQATAEAPNFSIFVRKGISVDVQHNAIVNFVLQAGKVEAAVTVDENASLMNRSTAEVSTRFDERRLSELPITPDRNVLNILHSVPGVTSLATGQAAAASGLSFSANGRPLRSNNFMIDGQDMNDPVFTGGEVALNNPDAIQEVHVITNQFRAEYGRNSGSIVNFVGKSGTNNYRGSVFWFHNNEYLNSCSNLDKVASGAATGFCDKNSVTAARTRAPRRREDQIGFTFGGPLSLPWPGDGNNPGIWKGTDRTFIFGDYQRWADRALVSGVTLPTAPTEEGRAILQSVAPGRPQVQALLDSVPAGVPNGKFAAFTIPGQPERIVPLGDLTGSAPFVFDDHQGSVRVDHRLNENNFIYGRYRFDSQNTTGAGQVTPPGLTILNSTSSNTSTVVLNNVLKNGLSNETRIAWRRFSSSTDAEHPFSKNIPSIQITGLEMVASNAGGQRTAIGFPPILPGGRVVDVYQITDAFSYIKGDHSMKFGFELRRTDARLAVFLNTRGNITYRSPARNISDFINDEAFAASITLRMPGGDTVGFYRWGEFYGFAQDEWRIRENLVLTYGIRYEFPGNIFDYLKDVNERVLAANGNNSAFRYVPQPKTDLNNFMPRVGFNWNPRTTGKGILGFITGADRLVIRGGYARTYDANFVNIAANVARMFPFVLNQTVSLTGAFAAIRNATVPDISQPNRLPRTVVSEDFRAPATDQFSFEIQRELAEDIVVNIGYVRTRGTGLMQSVDGNPCLPGRNCSGTNFGNRVDPTIEAVTVYANSAASVYDALQASFTKRLGRDFSAGLHYTWSTFIDDTSDIFNASASESPLSQDPYDRRSDRARSSYDRPHRLTGNIVYELPFHRRQNGFVGHILGGWQVNSFFTIQSGAPFSISLGPDPRTGNPLRPNLNTNLDLSSMTIDEILAAGGSGLFRTLSPGQRVGNAGRNILRSDGLALVDLGVIKNNRISKTARLQLRADIFNSLNARNFGIPLGTRWASASFLDKWATSGRNRRIVLGARLVF